MRLGIRPYFPSFILFPIHRPGSGVVRRTNGSVGNLQACWTATDVEIQMACFHEDYFSWGVGNAVPNRQADGHALTRRWLDTEEPVWSH